MTPPFGNLGSVASAGEFSPSALLARARAMTDPIVRAGVESLPEPLNIMGAYHFGWRDAAGAAVSAQPGKALRPALTLGAAAACGADPVLAAHAAAAVEVLHNFTLI